MALREPNACCCRALIGFDANVKQFGTVTNWHRLFAESLDHARAAMGGRRER